MAYIAYYCYVFFFKLWICLYRNAGDPGNAESIGSVGTGYSKDQLTELAWRNVKDVGLAYFYIRAIWQFGTWKSSCHSLI